MDGILFVDACVRPESRTRELALHLLRRLGGGYDRVDAADGAFRPLDCKTLHRRSELIQSGDYSDAMFVPAKQFSQARTIVIAAPYWDLSFPSFLKLYFENIFVPGLTFTYKGGRPKSLCRAERLIYLTTAGGSMTEDFGFGYVRAVAKTFFEIPELKCFFAEGLDIVGNDTERILQSAKEIIDREL